MSSTGVLLESLVTSLRQSDRCTLGIVDRFFTSYCSPSAFVTKPNDPAAAAHLCVAGVTVQCSSSVETEIWAVHCPARALTSCIVLIAVLTVFVIRIGAGSWSL